MTSAQQPTTSSQAKREAIGLPAALLVGCALSAGVHLRLAPEHMAESPVLGIGFIAAGFLLIGLGLYAFVRPRRSVVTLPVAVLLSGLILAYAVSRTAGLPIVHPDPEPVDAIGVLTKVVEIGALALALRLHFEHSSWRVPLPKHGRKTWTTY
jgi:hypothetical protein